MTDEQKLQKLAFELKRAMLVLNHFTGALVDGYYPGRSLGRSRTAPFPGSDREQLDQLFKVYDVEVRHLIEVLREMGLENVSVNYEEVWDELSRLTGITETSHTGL